MVLVRAKDLRHPRQGFAPRRGALDTLELLFQADREIGVVILPVAPDRALQFGVACLEGPRRLARRPRIGLAQLWSDDRRRRILRLQPQAERLDRSGLTLAQQKTDFARLPPFDPYMPTHLACSPPIGDA